MGGGLLGENQLPGDLGVGQSLAEEADHLQLPSGEAVSAVAGRRPRSPRHRDSAQLPPPGCGAQGRGGAQPDEQPVGRAGIGRLVGPDQASACQKGSPVTSVSGRRTGEAGIGRSIS